MNLKKTHLLFLLALLSFSCSKNDSESNTINKTVTEQDKQAAASVLDVDRTINELEFIARSIKTAYPNKPGILSGTTITEGQTTEGKAQYDIVFTGNASSDGKTRNGKITVVFEDALENGAIVTGKHVHVRSDDDMFLYTVNGTKFKGSLVFTDIAASKNSSSVPVAHINAQSFLIKSNTEQIRFSSSRKSYWTQGSSTSTLDDDGFTIKDQIYSLALITTATSFIEASTLSDCTLKAQCNSDLFTVKKGKLKLELLGGSTSSVDLGSGQCNDQPVVQIHN